MRTTARTRVDERLGITVAGDVNEMPAVGAPDAQCEASQTVMDVYWQGMKKVLVICSGGSGKSTFARRRT